MSPIKSALWVKRCSDSEERHEIRSCRQLPLFVSNGVREIKVVLPLESAGLDSELREHVKSWKRMLGSAMA